MTLRELLIKHEGIRFKPYTDTVGKITIGVGRNLDDVGINMEEAMLLLTVDIERATNQATALPWFKDLSQARKDVIVSMIFNVGFAEFCKFKKMIYYVSKSDFSRAADEMLDSRWAVQVGNRATELADILEAG